jgi:hypothetical protein
VRSSTNDGRRSSDDIVKNDEILDLKVIPRHDATNESDSEAVTRIAAATNSAQVRLLELGTFSCKVLDGHSATVLCADVSPCGRYLATCGKDKTMVAYCMICVVSAVSAVSLVGEPFLQSLVLYPKYEILGPDTAAQWFSTDRLLCFS